METRDYARPLDVAPEGADAHGARAPHILMIVCAGIACYKAIDSLRLLRRLGCVVRVVMTENATQFISPQLFASLSGEEVHTTLFSNTPRIHHIELADWADCICVVPATANMLAKIACGIADDLASSILLARQVPCVIAPAMNVHMWQNPATQEHVSKLAARGFHMIHPATGQLACGYTGEGKLPSALEIARFVHACALSVRPRFAKKRILITAGATREYLDPVRFLSNPASGKLGFALARAFRAEAAQVSLVAGPTHEDIPFVDEYYPVVSAQDMAKVTLPLGARADIIICTAAVGDWQPRKCFDQKIKKHGRTPSLHLDLEQTPDILSLLASAYPAAYIVGFAAETNDLIAHAKEKLIRKHVSLVVANDISEPSSGFGKETDRCALVYPTHVRELPVLDLPHLARTLLDEIATHVDITQTSADTTPAPVDITQPSAGTTHVSANITQAPTAHAGSSARA